MSNSKLFKPITIGDVTTSGNLFLAPMAGYTDRAFRSLCYRGGADVCYSEMVSVEAIVRDNLKTLELMKPFEGEKSYVIQVFGSDEDTFMEALPKVEKFNPLFIDLNAGCPMPKITKNGAGASLTQNPKKLGSIVKAMCSSSSKPITVKIRSGWSSDDLTFLEAGIAAQEAGAKAVAFHPRTRAQLYTGKADWNQLKQLKEALSVPVIGSGDLFSAEDVKRMLDSTGCDAIMVARGVIGNPLIFNQSKNLIENCGLLPFSSPYDKVELALAHIDAGEKYMKERVFVKEVKKHLCAYLKGFSGSSTLRRNLVQGEDSIAYYRETLTTFKNSL